MSAGDKERPQALSALLSPKGRCRSVPSLRVDHGGETVARHHILELAVPGEGDWLLVTLVLKSFTENVGCFCLPGWSFPRDAV